MQDRITVTMTGGVADVRLTRADKMNALDDAMFQALIDTGEALKSQKGLRAVVLSGEGRAFCAGLEGQGPDHALDQLPEVEFAHAQFQGLGLDLGVVQDVV